MNFGGPGHGPRREIRVAMKRDDEPGRARWVADEIREERLSVVRRIVDAPRLAARVHGEARRLPYDPLLQSPHGDENDDEDDGQGNECVEHATHEILSARPARRARYGIIFTWTPGATSSTLCRTCSESFAIQYFTVRGPILLSMTQVSVVVPPAAGIRSLPVTRLVTHTFPPPSWRYTG